MTTTLTNVLDRIDFELSSGDTPEIVIPLRYEDGSAAILTLPRAIWAIATAPEPTSGQIKVMKDTAGAAPNGTITQDGTGLWTFRAFLLEADTETLAPGRYYHRARIRDDSGSHTVLQGLVTIRGSIAFPA